MRDAFLYRIWQSMAEDDKIFFVCADFGSPILDKIRSDFPKRFLNVGIAEQNLINVTSGLALEGFKVFAYAIAPFITMRCFEQLRVNLALLSEVRPMNVTLIGVGAGYSYVVSGPTHQCYEDLTLIRALPNFQVLSPSDHLTSAALFDTCISKLGIKYLRLDAQILPPMSDKVVDQEQLDTGYRALNNGEGLCLISTGYMTHTTAKVISALSERGINATHIDLFNVTAFDQVALLKTISAHKGIVTLEEGFRGRGGVDALFFELLARSGLGVPHLNVGVVGGYRFELGTREELHEDVGIGFNSVLESVDAFSNKLQLSFSQN
jgi:transketolase